MCFSQIRNDIRNSKKYLTSPRDFWKDIERVFVNAKAFNDSVDVYNAAAALHEKANQFLKNKKLIEYVDVNCRATMEESKFTIFMRQLAKDLRKGIIDTTKVDPRFAVSSQSRSGRGPSPL